jgi:hypothetical protein
MSFLPTSEAELARQIAYALEDESFHPLDEVQDHAPRDHRSFTDFECSLSEWSFGYGLAWAIARMRDPFASSARIADVAERLAREAWRSYSWGQSWPDLMRRDREERGPVKDDPSAHLESFTRGLGQMRVRHEGSMPRADAAPDQEAGTLSRPNVVPDDPPGPPGWS